MALSFPTSIRHRLSLIVVCAVLLAIGIATAASAWREASRFAAAKQAELTGTANVFASAVADELAAGSRSGAYQKLRAIGRIPGLAFARVEDTLGRRFAEIGTAVVLEHGKSDTGGWFSSFSLLFERSVEVKADIRKNGQVIGQLILVANSSELRERLREGLVSAALAALVAALIGIVLAWRWQRRITVPIQNLTRAMEEVRTTQDFSKQVARESDDETGVMVDTFNDMLLQIRNRDDRLAEHRSQLEVKVEERTRDLRTAKEAAEAANVAKSEFLATMSHEIRTPMNGMLVMAELMSGAELAPRQQRYAEVIVKSGQSLLSIINDILDFSKIESGSMELEAIALDPAEVIDDVLNLFWERASSKGVDLAGYVGADVPGEIEGDPVRLNQVLSNLVNNALKFTESGHVVVIARKSAVRGPDGDELAIEFSVQDTGIGIPKDKLSSIFSAFSQADQTTTRKYGGTGLGLAICKKLVGAMGGRIGVTSTPGKGSAFSFTVATRALAEPPRPVPAQGGNLRRAVVAVTGLDHAQDHHQLSAQQRHRLRPRGARRPDRAGLRRRRCGLRDPGPGRPRRRLPRRRRHAQAVHRLRQRAGRRRERRPSGCRARARPDHAADLAPLHGRGDLQTFRRHAARARRHPPRTQHRRRAAELRRRPRSRRRRQRDQPRGYHRGPGPLAGRPGRGDRRPGRA